MRLIHFTASTVWRGHEQKIIYLYEAFKDYNYVEDQWVVCPEQSEIFNVAREKGINVITFNLNENKFKLAKKIKAIVLDKEAELLFIHSSKAHTIGVISHLVYNLKIPLVLCRTMIKRVDTNFLRKWKYNYSGIKKIICLTEAVVDGLRPAINDMSRLSIVGPVTDVEKFQTKSKDKNIREEFKIPSDYKLIVNVSAFVPVKNHTFFVSIVEELKNRGLKAKFLLIGTGSLENEIKELVKQKGLEEDVIFTGFRRDIPEIFNQFDLFLFTSKNEAAGSSILEAYSAGVPVVAANAGGIPEVVIDGKTGYLVNLDNKKGFADKVEEILNDEKLATMFKQEGLKYVQEHFSIAVISEQMFKELNDVYLNSKK